MSSFVGLLNNAILLLALGVIYDVLGLHNIANKKLRDLFTGILVGVIGISVMLTPWEMTPGLFFDTRWVLISLCGLYFGWAPTLIAVFMTVFLRLYQGGAGIYVGSLVIITGGAIGLAWRYWSLHYHKELNWGGLYLLGLSVQIAVILCMFLLPAEVRYSVISAIASPLLIIYPLITMLLGMLLKIQKERRQAEVELRKHKEILDRDQGLLKRIIDSIPDYIFYKSVEGAYLGCNKATSELFGCDEADLIGKTDFDIFEQKQAIFFRQKDSEMLQTGKHQSNAETVMHPDGREIQLDTLKTPFYGETGKLYGLIGIGRDVTEKQKTEEHIRKSAVIYHSVLSTALDGFWIVTAAGIIEDVNEAYVKMSGYAFDELLGMRVTELDALESEKMVQQHLQKILEQKEKCFISRHCRKDGSVFDVEINVTYWPEEGGKFFVFIKDITERILSQKQLLQSETRFRHVFENMATIAVQGYDKNRNVIFWNRASEVLYGYGSEDAIGQKLEDLIIPDTIRGPVIQEVGRWVAGGPVTPSGEIVLKKADGSPVTVFSSHVIITGVNNEPEMYCVDLDLTALKRAEERVVMLSQAVEQSPVSVVLSDTDGVIEYVNSAFEKVTGYARHEVIGQSTRLLQSGLTPLSQYKQLWDALISGESWQGEFQNRKKNEQLFWEYVHIAPVKNDSGEIKHFLAVKQDVTQQKEQAEQLLYQAHFDHLTGLPNRFLSLDRLSQMLKEAKRSQQQVAVFFLDLDDFKKVNDTLGHQVGDELLVEAAFRLRSAVRDDDVIGRLGGDEFIVLIKHMESSAFIDQLAETLLAQFRTPFLLGERELVATVSIGVAVYPTDGFTPNELLKQADAAMYHSKEQGRNTYNFYTNKMNEDVARRLLIEEQLRNALTKNDLYVCYQPVVDLKSREIIGAEALLRWNNEVMGNVPPDEFIPIAEQTGLIVAIGRYVLEQAVICASGWRSKYAADFKVAVNISPRQFRDAELLEYLESLLIQHNLPASGLELEITEGVLMTGHATVDKALSDLHTMGINISMDDFGTGYSSLSYLRSYPFDTLKVDKSFIDDISVDQAGLQLVGAAIAMGQVLGLKIIAEGIETEEQYQLLVTQQCDYGQGYLFSKPVPADEFGKMLEADRLRFS
ncbi:EAL domain-containing protein [Neptunomonas antarctica]|uniref:PAS domain S-box-containing protein/diguanylate cyclase (GGDEF) domain-containing protein n=1 Tax=Neptunomonas antarctica TaxID=619304 RepID=A0A1N7J3H3_9GAMM|nr:EAL domain-containing protein [Neptunomonas antarctica]SIS43903.1 PAS domain S-box-containing protein/diguanylate cyclase (GGDEF) domain-containing protein [Neptunomonas antarctica]